MDSTRKGIPPTLSPSFVLKKGIMKAKKKRISQDKGEIAILTLAEAGIDVHYHDYSMIKFMHKAREITYFPLKEWATGATIKDGRGFKNLIKQVKKEEPI